MPGIQNIIFDFGNVLLDIDLSSVGREMRRLLGDQAGRVQQQLKQAGVFELYETGGLSTPEFVDALRCAAHPPLAETQVIEAWNSILIGMPKARFDLLLGLRQQFNVFLLSNINELHERWIAAYMQRTHGIQDFEKRYFDGVYYSHHIRLRKPDRDVYEYVLADAELIAGETVFFDDLEINVEAARSVGMHGIVHPAGSEIADFDFDALRNGIP